jgi:hypothetical protein
VYSVQRKEFRKKKRETGVQEKKSPTHTHARLEYSQQGSRYTAQKKHTPKNLPFHTGLGDLDVDLALLDLAAADGVHSLLGLSFRGHGHETIATRAGTTQDDTRFHTRPTKKKKKTTKK